jgi:hypothetical protein
VNYKVSLLCPSAAWDEQRIEIIIKIKITYESDGGKSGTRCFPIVDEERVGQG